MYLKDAMPVPFDQNYLHLTFKRYLSIKSYSRKLKKLPNIVICTCLNFTGKMTLLKKCGPQMWLCLLTFRRIAFRQLNSLTAIDMFS